MSFPSKEERSKCWKARDDFWACLDLHAPQYQYTSGEAVPEKCAALRKLYEGACPGQWVKHFDRKRTYDQFKEKLFQGVDPLEQQQTQNPQKEKVN